MDVMEYNIPVGRADGEGDREGEGAASKERGEVGERGARRKAYRRERRKEDSTKSMKEERRKEGSTEA